MFYYKSFILKDILNLKYKIELKTIVDVEKDLLLCVKRSRKCVKMQ